jgi:hypothetical protein
LRAFCKRCDFPRRPVAGLLLAVVVTAVFPASCASFKHLTQVSSTFPRAEECGKCHVDIYREWSESDHAHAYTNPHFQAATNGYAFENCLSCHAPEPTLGADLKPAPAMHPPVVRVVGREEGVTCVSCHLEQGALAGPLKPTGKVQPHPVAVRPEMYHSSSLCGRCHEGTMQQWSSAPAGKHTCQQCHMEHVTRKITQATGGVSNMLVAMEKQVPQRRHRFGILGATPSRELIILTIRPSGRSLDVAVTNRVPHNLPTGDFGFRVLTLEVFGLDAGGSATPLGSWELAEESGTAVPPQEIRTWSLPISDGFPRVRAVLTRHSYDQDSLVLAEKEVEVAQP